MYKLIVCLFVVLVAGCSSHHMEESYTSDFSTTNTSNLKVLSLTSPRYYFEDKQSDVSNVLVATLGMGNVNVVSVQTSYSDAYLTAAQITYQETSGEGNRIRLIMITSDKMFLGDKQDQVKKKFDLVTNDPTLKIVKVQTIYDSGYLVAAEIYHKVT